MSPTVLARTLPYRPPLRSTERICNRCGITYHSRTGRTQYTKCRDCRGMDT